MSTKRKTLKQKRMSDLRRANPTPDMNTSTIAQTTPTYSFVTSQTKPQSSLSSQHMTMFSY
ncbi:MAG TPA: hypothetical protein PLD54_02180, partial [Candidatus Levybacteria bacterium]|nr:hypothetical protein [Candidatus Levybacteria bacterium]